MRSREAELLPLLPHHQWIQFPHLRTLLCRNSWVQHHTKWWPRKRGGPSSFVWSNTVKKRLNFSSIFRRRFCRASVRVLSQTRRSTSSSHGNAAGRRFCSGGTTETGKQPDPPALWAVKDQLRAMQTPGGAETESRTGKPVAAKRQWFCPRVRSAPRLLVSELTHSDAWEQVNLSEPQPGTVGALFLARETLLGGYCRRQRPKGRLERFEEEKQLNHNQEL